MSNERIDLTQIEAFLESAGPEAGGTVVYDLIAELKRIYAREGELLDEFQKMSARIDGLLNALRIIRDDLDETIDKDTVLSLSSRLNMIRKIRNLANDASQ